MVDVSGLTPDQQFEAGLYLRQRPRDADDSHQRRPAYAPRRNTVRRCLRSRRPGPENDDHNPPRIQSRNLFDIAMGHDNLFQGDRHKWSARLSIVNLTNKEALYNFLSTFSGTHYVSPRAFTGTIAFHF